MPPHLEQKVGYRGITAKALRNPPKRSTKRENPFYHFVGVPHSLG